MSNRQARREQMRTTRQQRAQGTSRPPRSSGGPGGPGRPRKSGGGGLSAILSRPFLLVVTALIIGLAVVLSILLANQDSDDGGSLADKISTGKAEFPFDMVNGARVGRDDAPIKLVQFEDFQCPFCLAYTGEDEPTLINEYVKTGKMQIEFRHLTVLGTESLAAAKASECAAGQDKFWQYHNELFLTQAKAGQQTSEKVNIGRFSDDNLKKLASDLGLDTAKFATCFDSPATLEAVQNDVREATSFGIRSTPGFLINNQPIGSGAPVDLAEWRRVLDEVLKKVNETPTASATAAGTVTATASASATTAATATPTPTP